MTAIAKIQSNTNLPLNLRGAFIRRTQLNNASLIDADLTKADLTGATMRGANLKGAKLRKTRLDGADLTGVSNLTLDQLAEASINNETKLPDYIDRAALKQRMRAKQGKLL